jgi:tetratricopeptide (TPR) repeat protein
VAYRLAWGKGDYAEAAKWADSSARLEQPVYQALGRFQRAALARFHGRLKESRRFVLEAEEIEVRRGVTAARHNAANSLATSESMLGGRDGAAVRILDSVLARHPLDSMAPMARPYLMLASTYARVGEAAKAEALVREYERVTPAVLSRNDPERIQVRGMVELATGRHAESIASFRAYREELGCAVCWLREIGDAFDAMQQPDSAIAAYEALATTPETGPAGREVTLPGAYRRLGELYEVKGDSRKALEYYGKFVDLWKDADPDLQPRVADVRKRIAELTAKER